MKCFVISLGTWGDISPFLNIALVMKEKSHEVIFLSNSKYKKKIEEHGITFISIGESEDVDNSLNYIVNDGLVWEKESRKSASLSSVIQSTSDIFVLPTKKIYDYIEKNYVKGDSVLISNYICTGVRYIQDKLNIPNITVVLVPFYLRSKKNPVEQAMLPENAPKWLKFWSGAWFDDKIFYKKMLTDYKPCDLTKYINYEERFSKDLVACMVPEYIACQQEDWPQRTKVYGFPREVHSLSMGDNANEFKEVYDFAKDERPILFNLGAQQRRNLKVFYECVKLCKLLNRKGIFLGFDRRRDVEEIPENIKLIKFMPIDKALAISDMLICHGGIGTCSEAFYQGKPIVVLPEFPEHWDTAKRIRDCGIGMSFSRNTFKAEKVYKKINKFLTSSEVKEKCEEYRSALQKEKPLDKLCEDIEQLINKKRY